MARWTVLTTVVTLLLTFDPPDVLLKSKVQRHEAVMEVAQTTKTSNPSLPELLAREFSIHEKKCSNLLDAPDQCDQSYPEIVLWVWFPALLNLEL